jgi:hypothetical protein
LRSKKKLLCRIKSVYCLISNERTKINLISIRYQPTSEL